MTANFGDMLRTYTNAQLQYKSTGNTQFLPAASRAQMALDKYIADLTKTVEDREREFRTYVNSRSGTGSEVDKLARETRAIREKSNTIASEYLIAQSTNEPVPVDWMNYSIKFSAIAGLVGALIVTAFVE